MSELKDDLRINEADIDNEIIRQPGLYAHYSAQLAAAEQQHRLAKLKMETFEAALYQKIRDMGFARQEKLTEKQIEMQIRLNPDYQAHAQGVIALEATVAQLKGVVQAMAQKRDMIVTLCSNARAERASFFNIREKEAERQIPVAPFSVPS